MTFEDQMKCALLHWVEERERVRLKKEAGAPRPWTEDAILRDWRFCCVDRCDDRVTRWIHRNVVAAHRTSPALWFNLVVARVVNWPPTLEALGYFDEWDAGRFVDVLQARGASGEKVFTGAYVVPGGAAGVVKALHLADSTLSPLWRAGDSAPSRAARCADWASFLLLVDGLGGFLVNQVVADLRYTPLAAQAPDWETFVVAGPGTRRGLNRLCGRALEATWGDVAAAQAVLGVRAAIVAALPAFAAKLRDPNNTCNVLCEFDKYVRVLLGEGTPRARYRVWTG